MKLGNLFVSASRIEQKTQKAKSAPDKHTCMPYTSLEASSRATERSAPFSGLASAHAFDGGETNH